MLSPDEPSSRTTVPRTPIERALVVTNLEILARFPLTRVMSAIRDTAVHCGQSLSPTESDFAIYQRWMRSFDTGADGCNRADVDPNRFGLVCPRSLEATLATVDPFTPSSNVSFEPVGIFNRIWASCGRTGDSPTKGEPDSFARIFSSIAGSGSCVNSSSVPYARSHRAAEFCSTTSP